MKQSWGIKIRLLYTIPKSTSLFLNAKSPNAQLSEFFMPTLFLNSFLIKMQHIFIIPAHCSSSPRVVGGGGTLLYKP